MMATLQEAFTVLRCPRTGGALEFGQGAVVSVADGHEYKTVGGVPVLIDFENSVFDAHEYADRPRGAKKPRNLMQRIFARMRAATRVDKRETIENYRFLADELTRSSAPVKVLVVGGGGRGRGADPIYDNPQIKVFGFDVYRGEAIQFIADGHNIPVHDDTFDAVIIQAVLEHVLDPRQVVEEIWRVLKPGGLVYAETPFMQQVHMGAYDFTRYTESGHRFLFRKFERIRSGSNGGPGTVLRWSLQYLASGLFRTYRAGKVAGLLFFWLDYLDRLVPERFAVDGASGVFFLGRKFHGEMRVKDAITHYGGAL